MILERTYITDTQRHIRADLLFDRQIPLISSRRFCRSFDSLGGESATRRRHLWSAGSRRLYTGRDGQKTRQCAGERDRAVVWRKRVQQESKIVDQCVVEAESCTDRSLACRKRIPGECDSRAEQPLCIVLRECRGPNARIGPQNTICIGYVIGSAAKFLIPAVCELVANTRSNGEVAPELH